ncbi:MAG: T9SS type A sorting domain-containing protein [Bacteroidetes bacterium]|nr:T9SS type A sorting domain-containing protein [Bacteroidota bacterium]
MTTFGQKRNAVWCFGDKSGIDFNALNSPVPIVSALNTRGSSTSICDTSGQLLFYSAYDTTSIISGTDPVTIYNRNHVVMSNGDSMKGGVGYNEEVIIPDPANTNLFYFFHIGVTLFFGIFYSIVDISHNGGLGVVTQKNIQLQTFANVDCLNAIKHGNGRDWWVIFRESGGTPGNPNSDFYQYLITPAGISNVSAQNVGSTNSTNLGKITFSKSGDKMIYNSYRGMIELYDYNRCTGIISNPITLFQETILPPYNHFWGSEFSPDGSKLYVTISDQTSYLFQFDLNAPNIAGSIDTLWSTNFPGEAIGGLKRGPDGKIYESGPYTSPPFFVYPYPDRVYNMYNMNLGIINSPDSLGAACDFQPYSFYLGGKSTYWGLPNNPDYDLGPLIGSSCDSLTAVQENVLNNTNATLNLYYHPGWKTLFVNAQNLKGTKGTIKIYDTQGNIIYTSLCGIQPPYFTKDIALPGLAQGVYVVQLQTEKEILNGKFVK